MEIPVWVYMISTIATSGLLITSWLVMAIKPLLGMRKAINENTQAIQDANSKINRIQNMLPEVVPPEQRKLLKAAFRGGSLEGEDK